MVAIPSFAVAQTGSDVAEAIGTVALLWTAPGDDALEGRAFRYDIRYQPVSDGPLDTEVEWHAASIVPDPPLPSPAGYQESMLITGLIPGEKNYFALRTYDDAGNKSALSNSVLVTTRVENCCEGQVGDVNFSGEDEPTIGDVCTLIDYLFVDRTTFLCLSEADIDQSGNADPNQSIASYITISDLSVLIEYLFLRGPRLPDCK